MNNVPEYPGEKRLNFIDLNFKEIDGVLYRRYKKGWKLSGAIHGKGYKNGKGYLTSMVLRKYLKNHHIVWYMHNREWPESLIHHLDGITTNNRIENLALSNDRDNIGEGWLQNPRKTTKWTGVRRHEDGKFTAQIWINGRNVYLGYFDNGEDAHRAYLKAREEYEDAFQPE